MSCISVTAYSEYHLLTYTEQIEVEITSTWFPESIQNDKIMKDWNDCIKQDQYILPVNMSLVLNQYINQAHKKAKYCCYLIQTTWKEALDFGQYHSLENIH